MKNFTVVAFMLMGLNSQAITLGTYQGPGVNKVTTTVGDNVRAYTNRCTAVMNIESDNSHFALDYSLFQCGGMDVWNDDPYSFEISGKQLVRDGKVFGTADLDHGVFEFTVSEEITKTVKQTNYDHDCQIINQEDVQFDLWQTSKYRFVKITGGYQVFRYSSIDSVGEVMKKYYPNCLARPVPVKTTTIKDLSAEVFKK